MATLAPERLASFLLISIMITACGSDDSSDGGSSSVVDLNISAAANADLGSSYENAKTDIHISNFELQRPAGTGSLADAVAYLDANGDGFTDVFMATGEFLNPDEVDSILFINDGTGNFTSSTTEFAGNMPPATHARKAIVGDFTNNSLQDIFVFDHGFDANPFPGSQPKLILQNSTGSFTWQKLTAQTGFHHGGASADIDNDGDIDIFVGGFNPFFFVNDGSGNFSKVDNRFDNSISKVFSAELIDVDRDGFVDLLVGAHEQDGDKTSIYWGSSTGSFTSSLRTILPAFTDYGTVLDFEAEDLDGDNDRDIVINRTGGGNSNLYIGRKMQLLLNDGARGFTDNTNQIDDPGLSTDSWTPWLRAEDIEPDGDIDIIPDDASRGFQYRNDGLGNFTRI